MLHIVFQQADVPVIQEAMKLDGSLNGEIFEIKDEWGVGPVKDLDTDDGWNRRIEWWKELLKGSPYERRSEVLMTGKPSNQSGNNLPMKPSKRGSGWGRTSMT